MPQLPVHALIKASLFGLLATLSSCGDDNKSSPYPADTLAVSGSVSGLTGNISLNINNQTEQLTHNGEFTAEARIIKNEPYSINIESTSDNLECTIENNSGNATDTDITDIIIQCNAMQTKAYHLSELAFNVETPSIISFAFHLVDRYSNSAITGINNDNVEQYLQVLENELPISASESFLEVEPFLSFNALYTNVFAIDISSSMSQEELDTITTSIRNSIIDPLTGKSKLTSNQQVSILTFDSQVNTLIKNSKDINNIDTALNSIKLNGNSTNLFGAIQTGTSLWKNEISLVKISYGNLILFTDGNDTSGSVSKAQALESSNNKEVYFIAVGQEIEPQLLKEFTAEENIFTLDNFQELNATLEQTFSRIQTFEEGLYVLSYATPKRSGTHTLSITAIDDYRCDTPVTEAEQELLNSSSTTYSCTDSVSYDFNTDNFTDVYPEVKVINSPITFLPETQWTAQLLWSTEIAEFNWHIDICQGDLSYTISESGSTITFVRGSNANTIAKVGVTESSSGTEQYSYLVMANNENELITLNNTNINTSCGD